VAVTPRPRYLLLAAALLGAAPAPAQQLSAGLTHLQVGHERHPFGGPLEVIAEPVARQPQYWRTPTGTVWLRVHEIGGRAVHTNAELMLRTQSDAIGDAAPGQMLRIRGELGDAVAFGGDARIAMRCRECLKLVDRAPPAPPPAPDYRAHDGKPLTVAGTLLSNNGEWWLRADREVLLANERGRVRTFPNSWHGHRVECEGTLHLQLRRDLHHGSANDPHEDLVEYPVLFGATVELAVGSAQRAEQTSDDRFQVLHDRQPLLINGVYDLVAGPESSRHVFPGNTQAHSYAWRNHRRIVEIVRNATPEHLDVCAKRMSDEARDATLRRLYAGILAACNDRRGRAFLARSLANWQPTDLDSLYVLGAYPDWAPPGSCDTSWADELSLRWLSHEPVQVLDCTAIADRLLANHSRRAVAFLVERHQQHQPTGSDDDFAFFRPDPAKRALTPLARASFAGCSDAQLFALAETDAGREDRNVLQAMLIRDHVATLDLYLDKLAENPWQYEYEQHAGPRVLAALRERLPELRGAVQAAARDLLRSRAPDARQRDLAELADPATPAERVHLICWRLERGDGPAHHRLTAARLLRDRIVPAGATESFDAFSLSALLGVVSRSDDREVVAVMVDLLEADYRAFVDEWHSARYFRNRIAGCLAEMTGESFGPDAPRWRAWLRR